MPRGTSVWLCEPLCGANEDWVESLFVKAILRPLLEPCDESWKLLLEHVFPKIAEKSYRG